MCRAGLTAVLLIAVLGCGDGGDGKHLEVAAWLGLEEGKTWGYGVSYQTAILEGQVKVAAAGDTYKGVEAYKLELRQNQLLVATRWYQVKTSGLFLLGEEVQEQSSLVERTFLDPILVIPYPLEPKPGRIVQNWSTTSEMEQGGAETHRFDSAGKTTLELEGGTFEAYRLTHTRTDRDGGNRQYDEYFVPENWYPQFDYPEGSTWKLR